MPTLHKNLIES